MDGNLIHHGGIEDTPRSPEQDRLRFLTAQETCDFNIHFRLRRYSTESKFPQNSKKYHEQAPNPSAHSPTVSTQCVSVSFGCG